MGELAAVRAVRRDGSPTRSSSGARGTEWLQREGRRSPRLDQLRHGVLAQRFGKLMRVPMAAMHTKYGTRPMPGRRAGRRLPAEWSGRRRRAGARAAACAGGRWCGEWTATFRPTDWRRPAARLFAGHLRRTRCCAAPRSRRARACAVPVPPLRCHFATELFCGFRAARCSHAISGADAWSLLAVTYSAGTADGQRASRCNDGKRLSLAAPRWSTAGAAGRRVALHALTGKPAMLCAARDRLRADAAARRVDRRGHQQPTPGRWCPAQKPIATAGWLTWLSVRCLALLACAVEPARRRCHGGPSLLAYAAGAGCQAWGCHRAQLEPQAQPFERWLAGWSSPLPAMDTSPWSTVTRHHRWCVDAGGPCQLAHGREHLPLRAARAARRHAPRVWALESERLMSLGLAVLEPATPCCRSYAISAVLRGSG